MQPLLRNAAPGVICATVWATAVIVIRATGQPFLLDYLGYGWQLVPYEVLVDDPFGSVWNLHIQPPLYNLAIGVLGRWSPWSDAITFQLMQIVLGMVLAVSLVQTLLAFGLRRRTAALVTLVATLNPEVLRNAFEPTYELGVAALLAALCWLVTRTPIAGGRNRIVGVSAVLTTVVMTRSLYHPLWLLAIAGLVAWHWRATLTRRAVVISVALVMVVVGGWMAKNQAMFGRATTSSWLGMNLQRAVIPVLPEADRIALHNEGAISDIAMIGPFGHYDLYRSAMPPCTPEHQHPALTTEVREYQVVVPNLNYECFLPVYDQAGRDARTVIRRYPGVWVKGRVWSARTWFATSPLPDSTPSAPYRRLGDVYEWARLDLPSTLSTTDWGQPIYGPLAADTRFSLVSLQLTALLSGAGLLAAWRVVRRRARDADLVVAVAGLTIAWTFVIGVVGELGEQARFRTMTDPLLYGLGLALVLRWAAERYVRGWRWVLAEVAQLDTPEHGVEPSESSVASDQVSSS